MKTLYVDLENGYKSLGSKESIKSMFGYEPLGFNTFTDFSAFIAQQLLKLSLKTDIK